MVAEARLLVSSVDGTDFDLDSINLGKHILNRRKLKSGVRRANISKLM